MQTASFQVYPIVVSAKFARHAPRMAVCVHGRPSHRLAGKVVPPDKPQKGDPKGIAHFGSHKPYRIEMKNSQAQSIKMRCRMDTTY